MDQILLICALFVTSETLSDKEEWINFKTSYRNVYKSPIEEARRFSIFQSNLRRIEEHNAKEEQGFSSYKMGVTKFADLTVHEFKDKMKLKMNKKSPNYEKITRFEYADGLPEEVDWAEKGAVTEVKDQGTCGSCWSFSATGTIEGANFIKHGKLISLSEQNLLDCDTTDCYGCSGGYMIDALIYAEQNGIMSEENYPYEGIDDKCRFNSSDVSVKITDIIQITPNDENDLKEKVALVGPVSVSIDASGNFQLYQSGIFNDEQCSPYLLDHGVLVVGYGTKNGLDYWKVKNSWGTGWGMNGYIWMSRNKDNQCGIASEAVVAVV